MGKTGITLKSYKRTKARVEKRNRLGSSIRSRSVSLSLSQSSQCGSLDRIIGLVRCSGFFFCSGWAKLKSGVTLSRTVHVASGVSCRTRPFSPREFSWAMSHTGPGPGPGTYAPDVSFQYRIFTVFHGPGTWMRLM